VSLFNRVTLQTPESVELEFRLAGAGSRALALLIDYLIWGVLLFVLALAWSFSATILPEVILQFYVAIGLLLVFATYVGYFVFFETLWRGQTPGKRLTKIRVVREDGRPIGLQQALLRALLRPIDDLFYLGLLFILFSKQEKRLGDMAAGTIVIEEGSADAKAQIELSNSAQALATQLNETGNISKLSPDDFATIREFLRRRKKLSPEARLSLSDKLADQAEKLLEMQGTPLNVVPESFLEAIYLSYQQQSQVRS
jgi:uncharacterized RDD family membrane protein YckC